MTNKQREPTLFEKIFRDGKVIESKQTERNNKNEEKRNNG